MYKLVAIDMDGTLLRGDHTISPKTKEKLIEAKNSGVKIVITSGRPIEGLKNYLEELNFVGEEEYLIAYNGGMVYNTKDFSVISEIGLKGKDIKDINKLAKKLGVNLHGYSDRGLLIEERTELSEEEINIVNIKENIINFDTEIDDNETVVKGILVASPEKIDEITNKIPNEYFEKYNIVRSVPFMLEVLNKECHKANGIQKLCEYLNLSRDEVIAIGDAANDQEMIKFAGLGVAMGNASDEIKGIADYVTDTNENDGICKVIDKFIFNN